MNTWVSFQSAEQPLLGQFSVSGNTPAPSMDEGSESSVLFTLMISRVGIKSYSWG
ncbi:hypothetical protein QNM99_14245 [Pseudomonas sp. PCH446]